MYGKMQKSGLTEIIPFICISAIWGQYPAFLHPEVFRAHVESGCRLMAAGSQVLFSFLVVLRAQKFTFGGPKSLMTVTPLFTDMM